MCQHLITTERHQECTAWPKNVINAHIFKICLEIRGEGHTPPVDTYLGSSCQSQGVCPLCEDVGRHIKSAGWCLLVLVAIHIYMIPTVITYLGVVSFIIGKCVQLEQRYAVQKLSTVAHV